MGASYARPEVLVETAWLADHLKDPAIRIVEVDEDDQLYANGHIPGAVKLSWWKQLEHSVKRDVVSGADFAAVCAAAGIDPNTTVIFYGDKSNWFATYAYWLFKYNGFDQVKLLNGGRQKWIAENRGLTTDVPSYATTSPVVPGAPRESIRALRDRILQAAGNIAFVDVRSPREYSGEIIAPEGYPQEGAQRGGHIPGAVNVPWAQCVREDGTFKDADALRAVYASQGVVPEREVIAYCRIGERSSHTWFVLTELLGYPSARNYDGSWTEYGNIVGAPIER